MAAAVRAALVVALAAGCSSSTTTNTASPSSPASAPAGIGAQAASGIPSRPAGPAATAARSLRLGADWPTYHLDVSRRGFAANGPDPRRARVTWRAELDGKVYASPLVVAGHVIAATENGSLYSLDGITGRVVWRRHLADPVPASALPCGNIDPVGVTGTPVFDAATGQVFAVATTGGGRHVLYAVDVATGALRSSRAVDAPGSVPATQLQRAALLLAGGTVYIAYGGNYGDCGPYLGRVAGVPVGGGPVHWFAVPTRREGGIWAASGPAATPSGDVLVTTGNGQAFGGAWDHSDSLLRLSPSLALQAGFAPTGWAQENSADADLGSTGPVLLPGGRQAVVAGKGGSAYLVDVAHPGGVGGQLALLRGCASYGGAAVRPTTAGADVYLPCTGGLLQVHVSGRRLTRGWQASPAVTGSPIVYGRVVWTVQEDGRLLGLDAAGGRVVAQIGVGSATRFATPAASGNALLVPTLHGVTAVQLTP